jgi:hypothetical protein
VPSLPVLTLAHGLQQRRVERTIRSITLVVFSAWLGRPHEKSDRGLRGWLHEEQTAHRFLENNLEQGGNPQDLRGRVVR